MTPADRARWEERVEKKLDDFIEWQRAICEAQGRHDERIKTLERAGKWALGVIAGVMSGLILSYFTLADQLKGLIGGK